MHPSQLRVADLRLELKNAGLPSTGNKAELVSRVLALRETSETGAPAGSGAPGGSGAPEVGGKAPAGTAAAGSDEAEKAPEDAPGKEAAAADKDSSLPVPDSDFKPDSKKGVVQEEDGEDDHGGDAPPPNNNNNNNNKEGEEEAALKEASQPPSQPSALISEKGEPEEKKKNNNNNNNNKHKDSNGAAAAQPQTATVIPKVGATDNKPSKEKEQPPQQQTTTTITKKRKADDAMDAPPAAKPRQQPPHHHHHQQQQQQQQQVSIAAPPVITPPQQHMNQMQQQQQQMQPPQKIYGRLMAPGEMVERVPCPPHAVGRVIGKGGETIKSLQSNSGARIEVDQNYPDGENRIVHIAGLPQCVAVGVRMVMDLVNAGQIGGGGHGGAGGMQGAGISSVIFCPKSMVGRVIGRGGDVIKKLQNSTGARIQIDQSTDPAKVSISGHPQAVASCSSMVEDIAAGSNAAIEELNRQLAMGGMGGPMPHMMPHGGGMMHGPPPGMMPAMLPPPNFPGGRGFNAPPQMAPPFQGGMPQPNPFLQVPPMPPSMAPPSRTPPLPDGWTAYTDEKHNRTYYHNARTNETVWTLPTS